MRQRCTTYILMFLFIVVNANNTTPLAKNHKMVEVLRRQLMNNNYDYMEDSEDSDQLTTQHPDELPVVLKRDGRDPDEDFIEDYHGHNLGNELSNNIEGKGAAKPLLSRRNGPTDDALEQGPPFYDDDNHLDTRRLMEKHDETSTTTTTVRYKVIEVEEPRSGRRSMQGGSRRRFLQEESPDHIAIVPLDEGPIPEFRLPQSRRQYMADLDRWELPDIPQEAAILDAVSSTIPQRIYRAPIPSNDTLLPQKDTEEELYGSLLDSTEQD